MAAALTIIWVVALWSFRHGEHESLVGVLGSAIASASMRAFGQGAWVLPIELGLFTIRTFARRRTALGVATLASTFVLVLTVCAVAHLAFSSETQLVGGVVGEIMGEVLRSLLGIAGAYIVLFALIALTIMIRTQITFIDIAEFVSRWSKRIAKALGLGWQAVREAWIEARKIDASLVPNAYPEGEKRLQNPHKRPTVDEAEATHDTIADDANDGDEGTTLARTATDAPKSSKRKRTKKDGPKIIAPTAAQEKGSGKNKSVRTASGGKFKLPPTSLLEKPAKSRIQVDERTLRENATLLEEKLASYGVKGRVDEIHPGPVVTMYEFEPESGTKISKIAGLESDLALALAAQKVRIVAPIPGKARVGIELPNDDRQAVSLREILEDRRWEAINSNLPMALGKDIFGKPVYTDLAKMPHLLVAGATGAGKSVGLNVMLASLLAKKTPDEVRLLMIDPKVVELAVFDGIPHMLLPVVTDMQKAALALKWAVDEMERRYQLFADAGARNITTFNQRVGKVQSGQIPVEKFLRRAKPKKNDEEETPALTMPEKLPYIVLVVDEFADLMMVAAKDVEACIARLAQKARAAGIHVILATQRPSVDVITGMIKANFPTRMAFKVSQREDSKTILGRVGAQNLLGRGDMLMLPPGTSDLLRVHCAYISEEEVGGVCDFLRAQGEPVYDENILKPREEGGGIGGSTDDPLYDKAIAVVANAGFCSISHVQRQLGIGYNKAANIVEKMEKDGIVGPPSRKAGGRREVFVNPQ